MKMKILVTGATGLIGSQLALRLANEGHEVHALYRSIDKTNNLAHPNVHFFEGDILDYQSIEKAVEGCQTVFHLAAYAKIWAKNPDTFYQINVQGTSNVLNAAKKMHVKRFILTSTAGKYGPSVSIVTEETIRNLPFFTTYEETKQVSEKKALEASNKNFEVVIVNPTRVYGPGLLSESNGVTRLIKLYLENKFNIIPGNGSSIGNYVYIDDVVDGHIRAFEKGKPNENYILGGENISFDDFFEKLSLSSKKDRKMIHIPLIVLTIVAFLFEIKTYVFKSPPLITRNWLNRYMYNWEISSQKAIDEIGYEITPIDIGLKKTIEWFEKGHKNNTPRANAMIRRILLISFIAIFFLSDCVYGIVRNKKKRYK